MVAPPEITCHFCGPSQTEGWRSRVCGFRAAGSYALLLGQLQRLSGLGPGVLGLFKEVCNHKSHIGYTFIHESLPNIVERNATQPRCKPPLPPFHDYYPTRGFTNQIYAQLTSHSGPTASQLSGRPSCALLALRDCNLLGNLPSWLMDRGLRQEWWNILVGQIYVLAFQMDLSNWCTREYSLSQYQNENYTHAPFFQRSCLAFLRPARVSCRSADWLRLLFMRVRVETNPLLPWARTARMQRDCFNLFILQPVRQGPREQDVGWLSSTVRYGLMILRSMLAKVSAVRTWEPRAFYLKVVVIQVYISHSMRHTWQVNNPSAWSSCKYLWHD